jgi:Domain of unknown function (DUF4271)
MISVGTVLLSLNLIPNELTLRDQSITTLIGFGLFASFLLIAFAKLLRSDVYLTLAISSVKIQGVYSYIRETHPLNKGGSILLLINCLLCFSMVLYILGSFGNVEIGNEILLVLIIPFILLIWPLACMIVVGGITGEKHALTEPIIMKLIGAQLLGLVYFIVGMAWVLNFLEEKLFFQIVVWAFVLEMILRLFKSITAVYLKGVSWYYIILYFCTLEILPLFVVYYYWIRDFSN